MGWNFAQVGIRPLTKSELYGFRVFSVRKIGSHPLKVLQT